MRNDLDYVMEQVHRSYSRNGSPIIRTTFKAGKQKEEYTMGGRPRSTFRHFSEEEWVWEAFLTRRGELNWVLLTNSKNLPDLHEIPIGVEFDGSSFTFFVADEYDEWESASLSRWSESVRYQTRGDAVQNFRVASQKALSSFTNWCQRQLLDTVITEDYGAGS